MYCYWTYIGGVYKMSSIEKVDKLARLAQRIKDNQESIHMKRVPKKTMVTFKELANSDFCGDYGMTLKWLVDGLLTAESTMIIDTLQEHEVRLSTLESASVGVELEQEKKKVITMLNGRQIVRKEEEKK